MQPSQPPQSSPSQQQNAVPVLVFVGAVLLVALAFVCGLGAVGAIPSLHGLKSPGVTPTPPQPLVHAATFLPGQYTSVPGSLNYSCHAWPPNPSSGGYGQCVIIFGTDAGVN